MRATSTLYCQIPNQYRLHKPGASQKRKIIYESFNNDQYEIIKYLSFKQECQTDIKYARRICGKYNSNDNIFGSRIFDFESRYR